VMIGDLSRIAMKMPFFMANHAENLQIDTQMALFMSESSVLGGTGLRHYGAAGSRDLPCMMKGQYCSTNVLLRCK
ncbi:MAG: hypothetical protein KBT08_07565, partial [Bacteroidales bacterium]|nr:hypothetical protein [Candidatus Cryptobacteroides onthequi]